MIIRERSDGVLVRVADDPGDSGEGGEFFGRALGVTSGGDDASGGILAVDAANGFAGFGVSGGSDRAGVEDDDVGGGVGLGGGAALRAEAMANRVCVSLRGAATKVLDEESGHELGATTILREADGMPMANVIRGRRGGPELAPCFLHRLINRNTHACNTIPCMRPSSALVIALLFAACPFVVQAQSSKFGPPEVMLRDAKHKAPKSGVQIGPGNTIAIQSGVGTPTTINVLSFENNGALLAAGKDFGRVVVWDVANKKFLCAVDTGQGIVRGVAISPDGQTLATAGEGDNFKLKLWHLPDGKPITTYDSSAGFINSVAFGPSGEWIVFAENGGPTRVLDLATGKGLLELKDTAFPVLSTDGTILITANKTEFIIWKTSDWSKLTSLPRSPAYAVPLALDSGTDTFVYSYAGAFSLGRLSTGEVLPTNQLSPLPKFNLSAGGFAAVDTGAPDLVFGHSDGRLWVWDTKSGKSCTSEVLYSESGALSPDGTLLAGAKNNSILAQGQSPDGVLLWNTQRLVQSCRLSNITPTPPTSQ